MWVMFGVNKHWKKEISDKQEKTPDFNSFKKFLFQVPNIC